MPILARQPKQKEIKVKQISVCKALTIDPVTIVIENEMNLPTSTRAQIENFMDYEAGKIEQTLHDSLMGGTYNRLLTAMMRRTAGCLIIPRQD